MQTFGEILARRRKQLDLTQETLAGLVGCSLSAIRKIESDQRRPSKQIAELLATHLEISPDERTLFLKMARGESLPCRLSDASRPPLSLPAAPEAFPPAAALPLPPTPFIGRQAESEALARMVSDPHLRLITLLGPGGVGKTRLALEAARAQLPAFEQRVYFVQLAAFQSAESILPAIAAALNIPSASADELQTRLSDYLRGRNTLLVLDNFEHLMDGAPLLSELLQKTPALKILVTSRERLNLQGEWTFELGGLTVPPQSDADASAYSALQLFELHARRLRPNLQLRGAEREAAIRICQRVDGMPLAIELAAAWVNLLSCAEIAAEIERGFDFLSSTLRDAPERHRSLRAVFEHSWRRLTANEQSALSRLTLFQGGFSLEAAESVVGAGRSVLSSLESKSLLRRSANGRFDLHEVIRQYAKDYLKDEAALRDSHSEYYLGQLRQSAAELFGADRSNALGRLFDELGNLSAAWAWALAQKQFAWLDAALQSLWMLYDVHGWLADGIQQTGALIAALRRETAAQMYLGRALTFHGMLVFRAGDYLRARAALDEAIALLRAAGESQSLPPALIFNGIVVSLMGDFSLARALMDEGVDLAQAHGERWFTALAQFDQGFIAGQQGDFVYAYERMQAGLSIWRALENSRFIAFALNFLSPIAIQLGRLDEAQDYLEESLRISAQIRDRWGMGTALGRLGNLALRKGDAQTARRLLADSLTLFTDLGARWDIAWALTQLGKAAIASAAWDEAEDLLKRAVKLSLEAQALPQAMDAALELAQCFLQRGEVERAAELVLPVLSHPAGTDMARQRAGELNETIERMAGVNEFKRMAKSESIENVFERSVE